MVYWCTGVLVTKECLHPALSPPAPSSTEQQILVTFGTLLRLYTTDILPDCLYLLVQIMISAILDKMQQVKYSCNAVGR